MSLWDTPVKEIFRKDETLYMSKRILNNKNISPEGKKIIRENLKKAGIEVLEGKIGFIEWLIHNPREIYGLALLAAIDIALLFVGWWAALIWCIIILILIMIKYKELQNGD